MPHSPILSRDESGLRILQICHRLPWPPIDGGKKAILGVVRGYSRCNAVSRYTALCMCPIGEEAWAREWRPNGVDLHIESVDARNRIPGFALNTLFSRLPYNIQKYHLSRVGQRLKGLLRDAEFDVVHFESLHTAGYAEIVRRISPRALRVLRCHNAEHVILERLAQSEQNPISRRLLAVQARRLKEYEARALDSFDLILAITEVDAQRFREINPRVVDRIVVVPAGTDLPSKIPAAPADVDGKISLLHVAAMDWLPNRRGLRWLLNEVLPRLDALGVAFHLDVVGKNMPEEFLRLKRRGVTVHGFVEDLEPIYRRADIAVVPLQVGGGMRVKILDYWARGIPVVATTVGAEGLSGANRKVHVVEMADTPDDFAQRIFYLGWHREARQRLRENAFAEVSANYGWNSIIDKLVRRFEELVRKRQ